MRHRDRKLARAWFVSGRLLATKCTRCGCDIVEMAEKCSAALDDPCPGFQAVEGAMAEFDTSFERITKGTPA